MNNNVIKLKILIISVLFVLFSILFLINVFASTESEYVSEGFEIDSELLKCATSSTNTWTIDSNQDKIITTDEWNKQTNLLLDCENYDITDWSALKYIKNMDKLIIKNCSSANLSVLCEPNGISSIEIHADSFDYITGFNHKDFTINNVTIYSNSPMNLSLLSNCQAIKTLSISAPELYNYNKLSELTNLQSLSISTASEKGLETLNDLKTVTSLKISCKTLTNLSFLKSFTKLVELDVSNCGLSNASEIGDLKYLRMLNLTNNNLTDISWINNLNTIYLSGNPISLKSILMAFLNLGNSEQIKFVEGSTHKLSYPTCDIIDTDKIKLSSSNNKNIRLGDNIEFLRNGDVTINVTLDGKHIFDYEVEITRKPTETHFYILKGDADNNELVTASDALTILKIATKLENMNNGFSIRKNDFDNNYIINSDDALHILKTAAKLEKIQTIDDPENFFDEIEYINGYPNGDFVSKDLSTDTYYTVEDGMLNISERGGTFYNVNNGQFTGLLGIPYENKDFDKIYWQLKWMIEDAISYNQLEPLNKSSRDFRTEIESNSDFNAYWLETKAYAKILYGHQLTLSFYITESNELYFYQLDRKDMFKPEDNNMVFRFTGKIPETLTYESIKKYYNSFYSKENQ